MGEGSSRALSESADGVKPPPGTSTGVTFIPTLTPLRGIAAVYVTVYHLGYLLLPQVGEAIDKRTQLLFRGWLWVDFFFVLSGFVLAHVYRERFARGVGAYGYFKFLLARLARIYPLHFLMMWVFFALQLLRTEGFVGRYPAEWFVPYLFLLQSLKDMAYWNQPSWSIGAEWLTYLVVPMLFSFVHRTSWLVRAAVIVVVAWSLSFVYANYDKGLDHGGIPGQIRCVAECLFGLVLYELWLTPAARRLAGSPASFVFAFLGFLVTLHYDTHDAISVLFAGLLVLSGASISGRLMRWFNCRPLTYLGDISYALYMTHWLVYWVPWQGWRRIYNEPFGTGLGTEAASLLLAGFVLAAIVFAAMAYHLFELPARRYLRRRLAC